MPLLFIYLFMYLTLDGGHFHFRSLFLSFFFLSNKEEGRCDESSIDCLPTHPDLVSTRGRGCTCNLSMCPDWNETETFRSGDDAPTTEPHQPWCKMPSKKSVRGDQQDNSLSSKIPCFNEVSVYFPARVRTLDSQ